MRNKFFATLALSLGLAATPASAALSGCAQQQQQQHTHKGEHDKAKHEGHADAAVKRGDRAMGFSHARTTHRFRLTRDGGAIEVRVNDAKDTESLGQVRTHLAQIARMFADGDFAKPKEVHARVPPGVEALKRLREEIKYEYEEMQDGGRVLLKTANAEALEAIHAFLRFQIEDHATGDSTEVEKTSQQ